MSQHCYLDRRYFEIVLRDVLEDPELVLAHPLYLNMIETENGVSNYAIQWDYCKVPPREMSVGCVVLRSQFLQHSTLLFLDPEARKVAWWNPYYQPDSVKSLFSKNNGLKCGCTSTRSQELSKRFRKINDIARRLLENYFRLYGFKEFEQLEDHVEEVCVKGCSESGFCNAYVLKYAHDWALGQEFDGTDILRFADKIEDRYHHQLPPGEPEVEFGPGGALIGGLGGVLIGGALGGAGGALLGGLGGAALGGAWGGYPYGYYYDKEVSEDSNKAESSSRADGALMGTLGGAALGGMSGGAGGALMGGLIGGAVGASLSDKNDAQENHRGFGGGVLGGALIGGLVGGAVASSLNDKNEIEENQRGALTGALVGGAVGGPAGALAGGVVGASLTNHKNITDEDVDLDEHDREGNAYILRGEEIQSNSRPEGALVGGLGGAAVGGLVAGPVGLVAGGLTGAVLGGAVTHDKEGSVVDDGKGKEKVSSEASIYTRYAKNETSRTRRVTSRNVREHSRSEALNK